MMAHYATPVRSWRIVIGRLAVYAKGYVFWRGAQPVWLNRWNLFLGRLHG